MPYSIFKWSYMYAKCLRASSYSKYSCAIPRGLCICTPPRCIGWDMPRPRPRYTISFFEAPPSGSSTHRPKTDCERNCERTWIEVTVNNAVSYHIGIQTNHLVNKPRTTSFPTTWGLKGPSMRKKESQKAPLYRNKRHTKCEYYHRK